MKKYVVRWQQMDEDGKYHWRYLRAIGIFKEDTVYNGTALVESAIQFDEEAAEWICSILDIHHDLNPEMIRV